MTIAIKVTNELTDQVTHVSVNQFNETTSTAKTDHELTLVNSQQSSHKKEWKEVSATGTFMHLLKANIGTGILAMPNAFSNSGLLVGSIGILVIGFISTHCMHILRICYQELCTNEYADHLDYDKVIEKAFEKGPIFLSKRSSLGRRAVNLFLLITLIGICSVYSLFIAENIREFLHGITNGSINVDTELILLIQLPFMIAFNCIHHLSLLTWGSTVANCLQATGLAIVVYNSVTQMPSLNNRPMAVDISRLPLFFGTASFSMEAIGMVIPLLKDMKNQRSFGACCGVLNTAMTIVTAAYIGVGFFGFLKYGDEVKGSITLNLPSTPLYESVRLMFTVSIFHTYALQLYVPINITFNYLQNRFNIKQLRWRTMTIDYLNRIFLVCLTVLLAAIVPKLDLFTSLTGAVSSSFILFIFPPIIEISLFWNYKYGRIHWLYIVIKDIAIIIFGFVGILTGTFASLLQIVDSFCN